MKSFAIFALALALVAPVFADSNPANPTQTQKGVEQPSASPTLNAQIVQGCYKSAGSLTLNGTLQYNSRSSCAHDTCLALGFKVAGTTQGDICYCGNTYPPKADLVDDSQCNVGCTGYDWDACGGASTWTIYNTGISVVVDSDSAETEADSSSASSSATAKATAVVTVSAGSTITIMPTTTATAAASSSSSSTNIGGIAAGIVVGVVAIAGIAGLAVFFIRRRRNQEIEEEHRRNAAVNAFITGSKPPGSSGGLSISDSRMDPVMAQRRMSSGSIADNQDYSRRILRVTNA